MIDLVADADYIIFITVAAAVIFASILVLEVKDMSKAIVMLAMTFVFIAGIYLILAAEFLFTIQMTVYAGGVIILFLFALMLTRTEEFVIRGNMGSWKTNALLAAVICLLLLIFLRIAISYIPGNVMYVNDISRVGFDLFQNYLVALAILGFLVVAVLLGAIYLIKDEGERGPVLDRSEKYLQELKAKEEI